MMSEQYLRPKILFVDDEVNVIDALRRSLHPYKKDWDLYFVTSGTEALELMSKIEINVVVSDMRMPGLNGAELLLKVKEKHPEVIRIILSGHSDEEMIMSSVLTAHQYLSKPCHTDQLIDTIQNTFYLRSYLRNENLLKVVNGIAELPAMPECLKKIEAELNSTNLSMNKIAALIAEDVNLTAKTLHVVNSAFFGLPAKIGDINSAVNFLGVNTIRGLVMMLRVHELYKGLPFDHQQFEELMRHSMKVARGAELIYNSENSNAQFSKEAYAAGLLHDIGKMILFQHDDYRKTFSNLGIPYNVEKEYEVIGVSHADVGAYLLGIWNLPNQIIEAVAFHHTKDRIKSFGINAAVYFANYLAAINDESELELLPLFENKIERWYNLVKNLS